MGMKRSEFFQFFFLHSKCHDDDDDDNVFFNRELKSHRKTHAHKRIFQERERTKFGQLTNACLRACVTAVHCTQYSEEEEKKMHVCVNGFSLRNVLI